MFEKLGDNLLTLIKRFDYQGVPLPAVRCIARQMLIGLDYLHRERQIIHTDLKPENVLLVQPLPPLPGRRRSSVAGGGAGGAAAYTTRPLICRKFPFFKKVNPPKSRAKISLC